MSALFVAGVGVGGLIAEGAISAGQASAVTTRSAAAANSDWTSCNDDAAKSAPSVVYDRIEQVTESTKTIPADFWTSTGYRGDIAKVICYESSYDWHAENVGQYGWYQMSRSLISSEGVSWAAYWDGTSAHPAGWYQCLAGERYILNRYHNPLAAWEHERDYGWY